MKHLIRFKFEILGLSLLLVLYFILRLPHLTLMPIFADEAIYIRWAQVMRAEPTLRFISLSDGKTPLFMWMMIPLFKVFKDPLMAGRILSTFAGVSTLLGVYFLTRNFLDKRAAWISGFLMVVTPMIFFFDRMALVDSMLAGFSIWCLYFSLWIIKNPRLDLAMFLGYFLGGSTLVKTPGMFNFATLPLTIISFNWIGKNRGQRLIKLIGLWLVAVIIGMVIYNLMRLGPGFNSLSSRNEDYVHGPSWIIQHPLDPLIPHLRDSWQLLPNMLTWPIFVLSLVGIGWALVKRHWIGITIVVWSLAPLFVELALLQTFTARYILFCIPPLLALAGYVVYQLSQLHNIKGYTTGLGVVIIPLALAILPLYYDWQLLTDPAKAPLPREERRGYLEDWTAGYGFKQIAQFLDQESQRQPVVVGTEGYFGTLPDGLQIYLNDNRNVTVIGGPASVSAQLRQAALDHPTYFVTNKSRYPFYAANITLLKEFKKPLGSDIAQDSILLFQVFPDKK